MIETKYVDKIQEMQPQLQQFAYGLICCDEDDRKDLIQETVMKGLVKVRQGKYSEQGSFEGWIRVLMRNTFISQLRKEKNKNKITSAHKELIIQNNALDSNAGEESLLFDDLWNMVQSLPDSFKESFELLVLGFKHDEIADQLGIPKTLVTLRIHKARKLLKARIGEMNHTENTFK